MKKYLLTIVSLVFIQITQAEVLQIDLSPTNGVSGLSPINEVPAVTNSSGSGGEISSGITFDTETSTLSLAIGYGSAAGFTDLTGPATGMHIHGPAAVDATAPVVVNLQTNSFPAANPASGGVVFGNVLFTSEQVSNLFAGLLYVNIHTATNAGGEVRGQLIAILESAPTITCPGPTTAECGSVTSLAVSVSDGDDDALTLIWTVNGLAMQTNQIAGGATSNPIEQTFDAIYQLGTNQVSFVVSDEAGTTAECSTTVIVTDTTPPVITKLSANKAYLWPPNHKMTPVTLQAMISEACGGAAWKVVSITSDQDDNGVGDGNTSEDAKITGDHTVSLRAERSGKGGTREYTILVAASDDSGNVSDEKSITVYVPHDARALLNISKKK
jgi:hypothetical protein